LGTEAGIEDENEDENEIVNEVVEKIEVVVVVEAEEEIEVEAQRWERWIQNRLACKLEIGTCTCRYRGNRTLVYFENYQLVLADMDSMDSWLN